jgi:Uma2 family endonuclease
MSTSTLLESEVEAQAELPEPMETDEALYEVVNRKRVGMPPMSYYAAKIATRLGARLSEFAEGHSLGEVVIEGLFRLPLAEDSSRNRRLDVAFVSFGGLSTEREENLDANAWDVFPTWRSKSPAPATVPSTSGKKFSNTSAPACGVYGSYIPSCG